MTDIITFIALGLSTGALYGIAAQGMVIIYRGSGVINFSHGAMALLSAAVFVWLRNDIQLPTAFALVIAIACAALSGFCIDAFIMRRIRAASPLAKIVVTLAVLGIIESIVIAFYGSNLKFVDGFLPDSPLAFAGISISTDRVLLWLIAAVITAGLWLLYKHTDFGRQTTAVAENSRTAAALGISPNQVSQLNWAIGGALAGLSGVLLAPLTGLMASTMVLLINPVIAAALVGRFTSFPLALAGGLIIGVMQSLLNYAGAGSGWAVSVPFLVIISVLVLRGQAIPLRGFVNVKLPRVSPAIKPKPAHGLLFIVALALIALLSEDLLAAFTTSLLAAIVLLSIVVLTGMAGQLSLGQYAFAGIGAFVSARLADVYQLPFSLAFVAAVFAAIIVGLLFALPALRTRGINLAIATLGLGLAIDALLFKNKDFTGGFAGTNIAPPSLFGINLDSILYPERYAVLVLIILALLLLMAMNLRRSASGRRLLAIRGNEQAAAILGINVVATKLYAFAVAAGIAAMGGVLMAFRFPSVRFDAGYSAFESIPAVLMAFLGGIGFIAGAIIGGLISIGGMVNELMSHIIDLNEWMGFAFGVGAIAMVFQTTDGLAALIGRKHVVASAPAPLSTKPNIQCQAKSLQINQLSLRFGGVTALNNVSLSVPSGQVVGLIGPNGAGKTSLVDAISGFNRPLHGTISIDTDTIGTLSPNKRAQLGLSRSFQSLELFDDLTVEEHLRCAAEQGQTNHYLRDLMRPRRQALADWQQYIAQVFGLDTHLHCLPTELSFGQRRLLGIARAVATRPSILLLDEPAAGLDSSESQALGQLIQNLAHQWGMAVLLIEHDMHLVMNHCDQLVVLDFGEVIASGSPAEIQNNPAVVNAYLGHNGEQNND